MTPRRLNRAILIAAATASVTTTAWGANKTWAATANDNWTTAAAWNTPGAPANGEAAFIIASGATYLVNYDNPSTTQLFPFLTLNNPGGGVAQLRTAVSGAVYNVSNATVGGSGLGFWQISSAEANLGSLNIATGATGAGTVTLSTGTITVGRVNVGSNGDGVLTQSGGLHDVGTMTIASGVSGTGIYNLNGGTLSATAITINSGGSLNLNAGSLIASSITLNTGGTVSRTNTSLDYTTLTQNGGSIATDFFVNTGDSLIYNGGSFAGRLDTLGALTLNADMTLGNGWLNRAPSNSVPAGRVLTLGGNGLRHEQGTLFLFGRIDTGTASIGGITAASTPSFAHQSGIHNVTAALKLGEGDSAGTYNLNGGTLNIDGPGSAVLSIGTQQPGQFNLSNGQAFAEVVRVGDGAAGTFNHNGGGDLIVGSLIVGNTTTGRYTQNNTGASVTATNLVIATPGVPSLGRYDLANGSLTAGATVNNGSFSQTGGRANLHAVTGSGRMDITATGSLTVDSLRQSFVYIADTARVKTMPNGSPTGVSRINNLFFEEVEFNVDGRWDLTNNDLIVDYTVSSPLSSMFLYISSGYNAGNWNGDGLNSSHAASAVGATTALGYAEASAVLPSFPASFSGQTVDATTILIKYTLAGDADLNGGVDLDDFTRLAASFGASSSTWSRGDFNYDLLTNLDDFTLLAANFGLTLPADVPLRGAVPEPASGVPAIALLIRRRRRS